jgi:hypothetical protein
MDVNRAREKLSGVAGNAAFMLHDQGKTEEEISLYVQKYGLGTEKEARQTVKFISNPLYRSYIFTYHIGYDLLKELFAGGERGHHFRRLLEEPVTPEQIRTWIRDRQN